MSETPVFVGRKIQDALKLADKGLVCPRCSDTFHAEPKLWDHAKVQHAQDLGLTDVADEQKARNQFRLEAVAKAYVDTSSSLQ